MERIDDTDLAILRTLQEDANLTTKELAAKVNLSSTPVFERLRRLQNEGYIKRRIALLDADKLHCGFVVYCQVKLKQLNTQIATDFTDAIMKMPEVTECYNVSGTFDYLLKIRARDMIAYRNFIMEKLGTLSSVDSIQSVFVLNEVKQTFAVPI
jgi:Lrp/AsnC family leucine-responsive transcriptional regulator